MTVPKQPHENFIICHPYGYVLVKFRQLNYLFKVNVRKDVP